MFSFFRKKEPKVVVPDWADFFKPDEYTAFMKAVDQYFLEKSISYTTENGTVRTNDERFGFIYLGLLNVAQNCKQTTTDDYANKVAYHFDMIQSSQAFQKEFDAKTSDFEYVRDYIGVRIHHEEYIRHGGGAEKTLSRHLEGNLYALLIYDLPEMTINISPEDIKVWGKEFDELFDLGVANIKQKYPTNPQLVEMNERNIWFDSADHFFTSNIVFEMEEKRYLIGTYGSLVALPHRHSVLIYPIENEEVLPAITQLMPVVYGMHKEGPGSLCEQIFWYKNGVFTNLPYSIEERKISFFPPEEFVAMVNGLIKN
jgi:hypothetical protein